MINDRSMPKQNSHFRKFLPEMLAKIKAAPQAILWIAIGFSLLFGSQAASAAPAQSDFIWNLISKSSGQAACTIVAAHNGEPTSEEINQACGSALALGWENGEYSLSKISSTATPAGVITRSWLETPATAAEMQTNRPLTYLAGKLIAAGYVDVSACNGSALLPNGYASPCGLNAARPFVFVWQNRFDETLLNAAVKENVPARMFKNLLIQESQMWPQASSHTPPEYGIGQLTENGTDTLLMWNTAFFKNICRQALDVDNCEKEYLSLTASERAYLRGTTLIQVRADCSACPINIDTHIAEKSIPVFAAALRANFNQMDQISKNLTGRSATSQMEWQEAWKLATANYHAGPGCTSSAMRATLRDKEDLRWKNISKHFEGGCESAVGYVEKIINMDSGFEIPSADQIDFASRVIYGLPALAPTQDLTATATPTFDETASATPTPDPAATITSSTLGDAQASIPTLDLSLAAPVMPLPAAQSLEQQLESPHVQNEVVLKIDPQNRAAAIQTIQELGLNLTQNSDWIESLGTLIVNVEPAQLNTVLTALQNSDGVEFAEPNYLVQLAGLPNDPGFSQQANLWVIQAPQTWDALPTMQEVLVAVIDTGVDTIHPDLVNVIWQNVDETGLDLNGLDKSVNGIDDDHNGYIDDWQGWNMVAGNNSPNDDQGHGTHLAGIIGAGVNNSIGIAGVAPNARILPVKVLDNTGFGSYAHVAEGIVYAVDMGARVINLGFGGTGASQLLQDAIDYATAKGVLVVAAGGNSGTSVTYYPAGYPGVIAVSAVDNNLSWAAFSSSGNHISLAAPGMGIYSTFPGGAYNTFSGTSMSSAQVSGVAALLAGQPQFSDTNMIRSAMLSGALDLGLPGHDSHYGFGVVRAFDALAYAGPILPTPTPWIVPTSTPGGAGGVSALASQDLWGTSQISTYAITNPANSIDSAFNDLLASSTGPFGGSAARRWAFTVIDDTTLSAVVKADLDLRFYMSDWVNDTYYIQVYEPTNPACAGGWCTVFNLEFIGTQPPTTLTTLTIPVTSILNTVAKVNNAQVRIAGSALTGGIADPVTIYIDGARLRILDVLPPTATPTSTPVFIPTATLPASRWMTATPMANEPHNNFLSTTDQCAACHRSHTAKSMALRSNIGEEQVCFACHQPGGIGTNVQTAFTAKSNTLTRFFSHDVFASTNIHLSSEIAGASFSGANRHIECEDCHSPHSTARTDPSGFISVPSIQQEMYNSSGVDPIWTAAGAPSGFAFMSTAEREYQLCFKCHSSYATLPTYIPDGYQAGVGYIANGLFKLDNSSGSQVPDSRDLAKEFNSYQVSFHPVTALGRNRNMPAGSFVAGWSQDSMTYCSDCHQNASAPTNGDGPHGSPLLHILDGSAEYITKTDPDLSCGSGNCPNIHNPGELCFKCHQYNTYAIGSNLPATTNFRNGSQNLHAYHNFGSCYTCHDTHGSEQDRLINFDTSIVTIDPAYNSQSAWQFNYANGTGTCYVACHDGEHGQFNSYSP